MFRWAAGVIEAKKEPLADPSTGGQRRDFPGGWREKRLLTDGYGCSEGSLTLIIPAWDRPFRRNRRGHPKNSVSPGPGLGRHTKNLTPKSKGRLLADFFVLCYIKFILLMAEI
jgi:hypothetical protein